MKTQRGKVQEAALEEGDDDDHDSDISCTNHSLLSGAVLGLGTLSTHFAKAQRMEALVKQRCSLLRLG
jgi:hypothetical protein